MGCWTTIIHPDDGRELRIYSGYDACETYHVGDTVHWYIDLDAPGCGKLFDGCYEVDGDDTLWVLIRDHRVDAVTHRVPGMPEALATERFCIEPYSRAWWSHLAWRKKELEEARHDLERARLRVQWAEEDINCTDEEQREKGWKRTGAIIGGYIRERLGGKND